MCEEPIQPPGYLQEDLTDLITYAQPRLVVIAPRPLMEPYYLLEEGELRARLAASHAETPALVLWLRQLRMFQIAFSRSYDWTGEPDRQIGKSIEFRLDLIGLAGTNSKLALDALLAGYYSGCMALERHMLETWRRVAYARLSPIDIWRWYPQHLWPADVRPATDDREAREGRMPTSFPGATTIRRTIRERGDEHDVRNLALMERGFRYLSNHSHPTLEGATQTYDPNNPERRIFGPTFSRAHLERASRWGLLASLFLLTELGVIADQGDEWIAELESIKRAAARLAARNDDFRDEEEVHGFADDAQ
jgi:hypothetical protein